MLLIKNGKILTMNGENYERGCVLIDNGKIKKVSDKIEETSDMEVIDAEGCIVMPGIIDAHCHIGLVEENMGFEGDDINEASNPVVPELRAIDGINPMDVAFDDAVKAGITGVMTGPGSGNVMGGQFVFMKTKGTCVDDMVILEPSAVKVAFGENPKRFYGKKGKMPVTRMATAALLRETLTKAKFYMAKKNKAFKEGDLFEEDFKLEALIPVLERKIPLKAHAHRADDILTAIRIAKEFNIKMTLDHCTEGHLISKYVKKSEFPAIVGPSLTSRSKIELQNKTFKTPGILAKAGVKVAIMTDHPVIPVGYLPICAGLAAKDGLGIEEAYKAITINSAEICGVSNRVGSIEEGKDADIAIFTGNPMEVFTEAKYTIINGEIVFSKNTK
ncbi:amidohydrolase [Clostridium guangxiense]|uniref:amidohydrolase n=1 Tax=Clostridium guangxiense TaxID=1662055 RepID=UPI001E3F89CB|nr:amidohydrolase [Clostridium guangxiense]MCD2348625.1 amidohydrolase [Clostridium guangxiense]